MVISKYVQLIFNSFKETLGGCDGLVMWLGQGRQGMRTEFLWKNVHLKHQERNEWMNLRKTWEWKVVELVKSYIQGEASLLMC
jgi:hypothetical protein